MFLPNFFQSILLDQLLEFTYVGTKLCNLTRSEADKIGGSLGTMLRHSTRVEHAVKLWILKYPALIELDKDLCWFRPMIERIASVLILRVGWALRARVMHGAVADVAANCVVWVAIARLMCSGEPYTRAVAVLLVALEVLRNLVWTFIGFVQREKTAVALWRRIIHNETIWIWLPSVMPLVVSIKVCFNTPDHSFYRAKAQKWKMSRQSELMFMKVAELILFHVPVTIVLMFCYDRGWLTMRCSDARAESNVGDLIGRIGDYTGLASLSAENMIDICVHATAFTATLIAYEMESVSARIKHSDGQPFFRLLPSSTPKRIAFFFFIFLYATIFSRGQLWLVIILSRVSWKLITGLALLDVGGYLLYKFVRNDLMCIIPVEGRARSVVVSLYYHVGVKIMSDFNFLMHLRHPAAQGGAYFSVNSIAKLVFSSVLLARTKNVLDLTMYSRSYMPVEISESLFLVYRCGVRSGVHGTGEL